MVRLGICPDRRQWHSIFSRVYDYRYGVAHAISQHFLDFVLDPVFKVYLFHTVECIEVH